MRGSETKNTGDSGAVEAARRFTGPKNPKKGDVNSDGVQVRPTRPDVRGPTSDAGFLTAEFQSADSLGDDLDHQILDRRPFEILPLGEPTKFKIPTQKKDCKGISACEIVTIVRGIVSRAGHKQTRSAGTLGKQTHHTRARCTRDKTNNSGSTSC